MKKQEIIDILNNYINSLKELILDCPDEETILYIKDKIKTLRADIDKAEKTIQQNEES